MRIDKGTIPKGLGAKAGRLSKREAVFALGVEEAARKAGYTRPTQSVEKLMQTPRVMAALGHVEDITQVADVPARLRQFWWGIMSSSRRGLVIRMQAADRLAKVYGMFDREHKGEGPGMLLQIMSDNGAHAEITKLKVELGEMRRELDAARWQLGVGVDARAVGTDTEGKG